MRGIVVSWLKQAELPLKQAILCVCFEAQPEKRANVKSEKVSIMSGDVIVYILIVL